MRRIRLVLAVAAVMGAMLVAFAGPAMADDLDCRNVSGPGIRCDHQLFLPANQFNFCDDFFFNCGFGFGRTFFPFGFGFDIDQDIGDTGDVTIGLNVS